MNLIKFQRPSLSNWSGLRRLSDWQDELDRLFESPLARTAEVFGGWAPALDLYEDKDSFIIKAELPGVKKEDVKVSLENGTLTLSGERVSEVKAEEAEAHHVERYFGRFQRSLTLPTTVAVDKVKAQYQDGVLTVTLPKTEAAKPKQIDVSVN